MFFKGSLEVGGRKIKILNWLNLKSIYNFCFKFKTESSNFFGGFLEAI